MRFRLTSLLLVGVFCVVSLTIAGCGGGDDPTVVESPDDPDRGAMTQAEQDAYEKELERAQSAR